ncbi:hypothetical protein O9993_12570 [Vibrio lentus]|nr:hypothetical protein [Vibrio lentus]
MAQKVTIQRTQTGIKKLSLRPRKNCHCSFPINASISLQKDATKASVFYSNTSCTATACDQIKRCLYRLRLVGIKAKLKALVGS